ncbi:SDR family oxidoreductase [Microbacterium sp. DT81.1]|uniref:SDR family oxidoreductase n=1 Tax=Microbacterium sp. DT81.1 TaxID=3393413 RepID=UPI003CEECE02
MTETKVWLITGAGRGMGVDIARAALATGDRVVATARDAANVAAAVGDHADLLAASLDITDADSIDAAVKAAIERFGRIDVLVNNAGNFQAGYFEEISPDRFRAQIETNFFGPLNVTRAVLPIMRRQRSAHIITITSTAGIVSGGFGSAYGASKFALEGWTESLREEVEQFGIRVTAVEPGFFRTELLVEGSSTLWSDLSIDDYADTATTIESWKSMNGNQSGDPEKVAANLLKVVELDDAPARWVAGADAVQGITRKGQTLIDQANAHLDLSTGLDHSDAPGSA